MNHIRNVVRSTLVIYRPEASSDLKATDIDDLRVLVEPEAARKSIRLDWINEVRAPLPVAVGSIRQATLNLLINACAATSPGGLVQLRAQSQGDALVIDVGDNGPGLPAPMADFMLAASDEMPPSWDGLGLWIIRRLVTEEKASIEITSAKGLTTVVRVIWPFRREADLERDSAIRGFGEAVHAG